MSMTSLDNDLKELKSALDESWVPKILSYKTSFTVFPDHTNYNNPPSIFGGKMLAEMDNAAAMACRRALYNTACTDAITTAVNNVVFKRPAYIGDIVHIEATITDLGTKSLTVTVKCQRENKTGEIAEMATGTFVFCAREDGKPVEHCISLPDKK